MCGRFSLQTPVPDLEELFEAEATGVARWPARYNVAPTDEVIAVRRAGGGRKLIPLRWGLVPHWSEDPDSLPPLINARAESLERRRAFRDLILDRRCAVLADGFYEWRTEGGVKQPYYVRRRDRVPLALAGLWDVWEGRRSRVDSCTIVTTDANPLLARLHDRMPAILDDAGAQRWLDLDFSPQTLDPLAPLDATALEVVPVSRRVNHSTVDDPSCVESIDAPIRDADGWERRTRRGNAPPDQLGLFREPGRNLP